jgi:hypothetical protein
VTAVGVFDFAASLAVRKAESLAPCEPGDLTRKFAKIRFP